MSCPPKYDIVIYRTLDFSLTMQLKNEDGTLLNLTGFNAESKFRYHMDDLTSVDLHAVVDSATSKISISLSRLETTDLKLCRGYYDIITISPGGSGTKDLLLTGSAEVRDPVTRV
jgi:hypothetical protein